MEEMCWIIIRPNLRVCVVPIEGKAATQAKKASNLIANGMVLLLMSFIRSAMKWSWYIDLMIHLNAVAKHSVATVRTTFSGSANIRRIEWTIPTASSGVVAGWLES